MSKRKSKKIAGPAMASKLAERRPVRAPNGRIAIFQRITEGENGIPLKTDAFGLQTKVYLTEELQGKSRGKRRGEKSTVTVPSHR